MLGFVRDLGLDLAGLDLDALEGQVQDLAPAERLNRVLEAAREARVLPPDVDLAHFARLFQVFCGNEEAPVRAPQKRNCIVEALTVHVDLEEHFAYFRARHRG